MEQKVAIARGWPDVERKNDANVAELADPDCGDTGIAACMRLNAEQRDRIDRLERLLWSHLHWTDSYNPWLRRQMYMELEKFKMEMLDKGWPEPATSRDPRIEPRIGDVFACPTGCVYRVVEVGLTYLLLDSACGQDAKTELVTIPIDRWLKDFSTCNLIESGTK